MVDRVAAAAGVLVSELVLFEAVAAAIWIGGLGLGWHGSG